MIEKDKEIRVLDRGFIIFKESLGSDKSIVDAARVSYSNGTKKKSTDEQLINYLISHNHMTPLEMTEFMVQVKAPIFVARQWFRHRMGEFNEMSLRYSESPDEFYFPHAWRTQDAKNKQASSKTILQGAKARLADALFRGAVTVAADCYWMLVKLGVSREMARMVLPVNIYTTWYWKVNGRALANFINLRTSEDAQPEIREYAYVMEQLMEQVCPLAVAALRTHTWK